MMQKEAEIWLEKARALEEDRRLLVRAWEALDRLELGLNGHGQGLTDTDEYRTVFRRLGERLTEVNTRQGAYLARVDDYAYQTAESGRKGGMSGETVFVRRLMDREGQTARGMRAPVISSALVADAREVAARQGMSLRTWIEAALRQYLTSRAVSTGTRLPLTERVREVLRNEPLSARQLAERCQVPVAQVTIALKGLKRKGIVRLAGPWGVHNAAWVSLEE